MRRPVAGHAWTTADDLVEVLGRSWKRGTHALARANGEPFVPFSLPVRAPGASDVLEHLDEVRAWAERFARDSSNRAGRPLWRVEHRALQSRHLGANELPARVWIDTLEQLCDLVGAGDELAALDAIVARTAAAVPLATRWVAAHPLRAVEHRDVWDQLLATVAWIDRHPTAGLYLRQLDIEGVDTKFVERHHRILDDLLRAVLGPGRIDEDAPAGDFTRRFRFRPKPDYVRLRLLAPQATLPPGLSELRLRADELPGCGIAASTVFVVENEVTFLAFPAVADAVVIFGSGYGLEAANAGEWLGGRRLVYWGDIDTHGLAILDGLRSRFAHVGSMLMDTRTLLAHPAQWGREPVPTSRALTRLTAEEAELYADLVEGRYGPNVRLEQERVRYSLLVHALRSWEPAAATMAAPGR